MVTGDYHHTAIAVARGVGMISQEGDRGQKRGQLIIIQAKAEKQGLVKSLVNIPSALKSPRGMPNASVRRGVSFAVELPSPLATCPEKAPPFAERQETERQRAQGSVEGLTFTLDSSAEDLEPVLALTTLAQVLPCPALPCPALPCPALPCPAQPCPARLGSFIHDHFGKTACASAPSL